MTNVRPTWSRTLDPSPPASRRQRDVGGRKGPDITAERPRAPLWPRGQGHQSGAPGPESLPPVSQGTRPNPGVGRCPGRSRRQAGKRAEEAAAAYPASPSFPQLPSHRPPAHCIMEAWARHSSSVFSSGKWGEGRRLRSRCLCWSQMISPQLFTSTHCKHTCRRAGTRPALGLHPSSSFPTPNSHPRTSSPTAVLSIPRRWGQTRQECRLQGLKIQLSP